MTAREIADNSDMVCMVGDDVIFFGEDKLEHQEGMIRILNILEVSEVMECQS